MHARLAPTMFVASLLSAGADAASVAAERSTVLIDSAFHQSVSRALTLAYTDRYEEAVATIDTLVAAHPTHPAPSFFKAFIYQNWMLNYRLNRYEKELEESARRTIETGNRMMESDDDPWLNFLVGAAYGYRGLHRFRKHQWIRAYFDCRKGIDNLQEALTRSPDLYDCHLGLGSYHYWRSARSRLIRRVVFWMRDRRELGLSQLRLAVDRGVFSSHEAIHGLMLAHFDHGDYDEALALNDTAMRLYEPPSLGALYMRGRLMARLERWEEVETLFEQIRERLPDESVGYDVECMYWIARAYHGQGRAAEAAATVALALSRSRQRHGDAELESAVDSFDSIIQRLQELDETLPDG